MKKFYYHDGNQQRGPFSIEELKEFEIQPETYIWYDGLQNWIKAIEIEELKIIFKSTPPPFRNLNREENTIPPPYVEAKQVNPNPKKKSKSTLYSVIAFIVAVFLIVLYSKYNETEVRNELYKSEVEEEENLKREIRNNIGNYVSIRQSDYSADKIFGGISDLNYEVINKSDFVIDLVKIEVKYIRTNGGLFKTEIIDIENIESRGSVIKRAPDSNKGISVEYSVLNIFSSQLSLCYKKDEFSNNSNDPYKCD